MFPDEPEGNSFSDLSQYLGAAAPMGTAIEIKLIDGKAINAYINHSQESLPGFLEIFVPKKNGVDKDITKVPVDHITWFRLKKYGKTESYLDKDGVPMAKLPIIAITTKRLTGNGKIINPGVTSIYGDEIDFSGEITPSEEEKQNEQ